jgi:hypothetical protein
LKTGKFETEENNDLAVGDGPGKYKTFDLGVNGTAGIEFKGLFIAGNFSHGFTDMYTATYDGSFKNQVYGVTLGIFIGKPVSLEDKPKDTDGDGIIDKEDSCVTEPGHLLHLVVLIPMQMVLLIKQINASLYQVLRSTKDALPLIQIKMVLLMIRTNVLLYLVLRNMKAAQFLILIKI